MIAELLKNLANITGLAGVALGVLLIVFRETIRKNIFPKLTKKQAYRLLLTIAVLIWSAAIAGIAPWIPPSSQNKEHNLTTPASRLKIVYIQYRGTIQKMVVEELNRMLNSDGVPTGSEVERIDDEEYYNGIRYFYKEDRDLAEFVARKVNSFFSNKGCAVTFPLEDLSSERLDAEKGQIEVWINQDCP